MLDGIGMLVIKEFYIVENMDTMNHRGMNPTVNQFKPLIETISTFSVYINELRKQFLKEAIKSHIDSVERDVADRLMKKKFNHSEMQIISYIEAKPERVATYQELVQAMPFSQGMLSRYIKRLAENGLIIKFHSEHDQKAILVSNTEIGNSVALVHNELHKREDEYYNTILNHLSEDKINHTIEVLKSLMDSEFSLSEEEFSKLSSMKVGIK